MLSPVNPPSESLNLGVVLETPNTYLSMFSSSPYNFAFCIQIFNPAVIFFFFWHMEGCRKPNLLRVFKIFFHCEIKHLEKRIKQIYSLVNYYKHLCNYHPIQEKKIYFETCTKKILTGLRAEDCLTYKTQWFKDSPKVTELAAEQETEWGLLTFSLKILAYTMQMSTTMTLLSIGHYATYTPGSPIGDNHQKVIRICLIQVVIYDKTEKFTTSKFRKQH